MPQSHRLDFVDLRLFVNIAEVASLSKGAEKSSLSLAAASTRIKNLELNLGAQLLTRTARGVVLTGPGQTFLHHARRILDQVEQLNADFRQYSDGVRGKIRVAANVTSTVDLLPAAARAFLKSRDNVEIDLRQCDSADGLAAIIDGSVDLALVAVVVKEPNIEAIALQTERFVLAMPLGHALAQTPSTTFSDIFDYELIGMGDANTRHPHFSRFAGQVNKVLKFRIHVNNYEDVCRLVMDGIGIAAIPEPAARKYGALMPIAIVPIADAWASRQVSLCLRTPRTAPAYVYEFADVIVAQARAEISADR